MTDRKSEQRYLNRELSWLEFNRRVLEEACDESVPLLERVKFLSITATNLDEFFMVRVGGLQQLRAAEQGTGTNVAMDSAKTLREIGKRARTLVAEQQTCWLHGLRPALAGHGIRCLEMADASSSQYQYVRRLFEHEILPVLTPVAIDSTHAQPRWPGLGLNLCVRLRPSDGTSSRKSRFAVVRLPRNQGRTLMLPEAEGHDLVLIEDVVRSFAGFLFPGETVAECIAFRVTRNADLSVREDLAGDLLERMREVLVARKESACVRLELEKGASKTTRSFLQSWLASDAERTDEIRGPLDLGDLFSLSQLTGYEELKVPPWPRPASPDVPDGESMFRILARRDIILFHPPEHYDPVLRLLNEAADDPDVLAMKLILYRTSRDSAVVAALIRAAQNGKQVCAIVELKARFDEERNIEYSQTLEQAGVQVVYGIKKLKTHAKACVIIRREPNGIRRYVHFGTGNYNEGTARLYTDVSFMTCHDDYGADASSFFNTITGYSQPQLFRKISAAPHQLRDRLLELIAGETQRCGQGGEGRIVAKMNSLVDQRIIEALYEASQAGVHIRLVVRGICCLRPGVPGLSDRIVVTSIVDRLLEHHRILCFYHGGKPLMFISSADWMPRNLDRRIELLVPVEDPHCVRRLRDVLDVYCADNVKSRQLMPDGTYQRVHTPETDAIRARAQEELYHRALNAAERVNLEQRNLFRPQLPGNGKM